MVWWSSFLIFYSSFPFFHFFFLSIVLYVREFLCLYIVYGMIIIINPKKYSFNHVTPFRQSPVYGLVFCSNIRTLKFQTLVSHSNVRNLHNFLCIKFLSLTKNIFIIITKNIFIIIYNYSINIYISITDNHVSYSFFQLPNDCCS